MRHPDLYVRPLVTHAPFQDLLRPSLKYLTCQAESIRQLLLPTPTLASTTTIMTPITIAVVLTSIRALSHLHQPQPGTIKNPYIWMEDARILPHPTPPPLPHTNNPQAQVGTCPLMYLPCITFSKSHTRGPTHRSAHQVWLCSHMAVYRPSPWAEQAALAGSRAKRRLSLEISPLWV